MADKKMMKVTLTRGVSGRLKSHQACVRGLGLRRIHQTVSVEDTPEGSRWHLTESNHSGKKVDNNEEP